MTIAICTHPDRCGGMEAAHSDMAAQLLALTVERDRLRAQLAQAQDAASRLQDALGVAQEGYNVYYGMYCDLSAKGAK